MAKFKRKKIVITTGDVNGIGLEVTLKALDKLGPSSKFQYIFFRSSRIHKSLHSLHKKVIKKFDAHSCNDGSWRETLLNSQRPIIEIVSHESPPQWVQVAAELCLSGVCSALVTGPLSKELIIDSGFNAIGHTDILKTVSGTKTTYMTFLGSNFNVLSITGHLPFKDVANAINEENIFNALAVANDFIKTLNTKQKSPPLALLGLNPHAGDGGIIGREEVDVYSAALLRAKKANIRVDGPITPDAAFLKKNWKKYSIFVCSYHDQALIPFKLIHGQDSGAHITVGLPFIRTSVDHGTATDIFGKFKANPRSMMDALYWAQKFLGG